MELDENVDEIRLSRTIVDRLRGRFQFLGTSTNDRLALPVDVPATNEQLVLAGRRLDEFSAVAPTDDRVMRLDRLLQHPQQLHANDIVLLLLCGGMSFRSGGEIHPLKLVQEPNGGPVASLLARQLNRLAKSSLSQATCYIVGTPLNKAALEVHLASMCPKYKHRVYACGLAPKLLTSQRWNALPLVMRDSSGQIAYNPMGHFDALRWFILSGMLFESIKSKVVITVSYSNWGKIFTETTVAIARMVEQRTEHDQRFLFLAEVTQMPPGREKGSILAASTNSPQHLRLIKPNYGRGELRLPTDTNILLSTNTLYFSVPALLRRLEEALATVGLSTGRNSLLSLLQAAAAGVAKDQLAAVIEAAFPIEAQLIPTHVAETGAFLRAERDLDQLTLLPGPSAMEPVEVGSDRAVFLKLPSDFEDPAKLAYVFEP